MSLSTEIGDTIWTETPKIWFKYNNDVSGGSLMQRYT